MKMAPDSSLKVEIRPDRSDVKNVSGTHVSVCLDVLNLVKKRKKLIIFFLLLILKSVYTYIHFTK